MARGLARYPASEYPSAIDNTGAAPPSLSPPLGACGAPRLPESFLPIRLRLFPCVIISGALDEAVREELKPIVAATCYSVKADQAASTRTTATIISPTSQIVSGTLDRPKLTRSPPSSSFSRFSLSWWSPPSRRTTRPTTPPLSRSAGVDTSWASRALTTLTARRPSATRTVISLAAVRTAWVLLCLLRAVQGHLLRTVDSIALNVCYSYEYRSWCFVCMAFLS